MTTERPRGGEAPLDVRARLDRTTSAAIGWILLALVACVGWQILSRFVLRAPSSVTEELSRFLLVWLGLLAGAHGFGRRLHVSLDLHRALRRTATVGAALAALVVAVWIVGGVRLIWTVTDLEQRSPALGLPLGWVYLALPLSGLIILAHLLLDLGGTPPAVDHEPAEP